MKTINYTGSSKLISRIVNLLNRKVPLPLDGDGNPDWGTNGQVLSTNGVDGATWVNQGGGGSGGYTMIGEFDVNDTNSHSISLTEDADKFYFIELIGGWEYFTAISCSRLYSSDSWCFNNGTNTDFFYLNNNPSFSYAELTYRSKNSVTIKASNANVKLRIYGYMRK